jgi:hypothetical protein
MQGPLDYWPPGGACGGQAGVNDDKPPPAERGIVHLVGAARRRRPDSPGGIETVIKRV